MDKKKAINSFFQEVYSIGFLDGVKFALSIDPEKIKNMKSSTALNGASASGNESKPEVDDGKHGVTGKVFELCDQITVAGCQYNGRQDTIKRLVELELVQEPDNPYDPNAIIVMFQGRSIGYVPRDLAKELREEYLDRGFKLWAKLKRIDGAGDGQFWPVIEIYSDAPPKAEPVVEPENKKAPDSVLGGVWRI